jgi:hypothetical protein
VSRTLPHVSRTAFVVEDVARESLLIHRSTCCSEKTGLRLVLTSRKPIETGASRFLKTMARGRTLGSRSAGAGRAKTKGRSASKSTLVYKSLSSCRMKTILSSRKRNAKAWGRGRCAVHWLSLFGQYRVESRTAIPAPNRAPGVIQGGRASAAPVKSACFQWLHDPFDGIGMVLWSNL